MSDPSLAEAQQARSARRAQSVRRLSSAERLTLIGLGYFAAIKLALLLPDAEKILAVAWPAAGIGLAALLLNPRSLWPGILAVIFLVGNAGNLLGGRPLPNSLGFMLANILESLCCALFIQRMCGERVRFTRAREIGALLAASAGVNAGTALLGAGTATLAAGTAFREFWLTWWVADGLGLLLVTPLIVCWAQPGRLRSGLRYAAECSAFFLVWCVTAWQVFQPHDPHSALAPQPYILVLLLTWPAFRMGMRTVTLALAVLAALAATSPAVQAGPLLWGGGDVPERMLFIQLFLACASATAFLFVTLINEREQGEAAVRESEERFRHAFDQAAVGFFHGGPGGTFLRVNQKFCDIVGYTREELATFTFRDITHPGDLEQDEAHLKALTSEPCRAVSSQKRYRRKDGAVVWVARTVSPVCDDEGRIKYIMGVVEDITERMAIEENLQRQNDMLSKTESIARIGSWAWDVETDTVHWSEELFRIFGFDPALSAPSFAQQSPLYNQSDLERLIAAAVETQRTGQPFELELRINRADGETRVCEGRGYLETKPGAHPMRMYGLLADITQRKRVEELREQIERTIRHDLRAPASSAIYLAQLLRAAPGLTEQHRKLVDLFEHSGRCMLDTLNSTLDLFRIETGQYQFTPAPVDALQLLLELKEMLRLSGRRPDVGIRIVPPAAGAQALCLGQASLLRMALQNLLSNALDASPGGAEVEAAFEPGARCRITLRNKGAVPAAIRERFFEKYVTLGKSGGTGIGTYSARLMVLAQGGAISMRASDEDDETVVTVDLPVPGPEA
jgi:PAS domain S-box